MGDPLTITNVAATSAQGGLLTNNGTTVDYAAPAELSWATTPSPTRRTTGQLDSNVATVTVTVTGVNDAPVAVDDSDTVDRGRYTLVAMDLLVQRHGRSGCSTR